MVNQKGLKTFILILGIFIVLLLIFLLFISLFKNSSIKQYTLSQDSLLVGAFLSLQEKDSFFINFSGEQSKFVIYSFDEEVLKLRSGEELIEILVNETKDFDLDGDGFADVVLSVEGFFEKEVELFLETPTISFSEECVEDWECTNWSVCINYFRKRLCVDQNVCGNESGKPKILEVCSSSGITEYFVNWSLSNESSENESLEIVSFESNLSEGDYVDCGVSENYVNDCFLANVGNCTPSKVSGEYVLDLGEAIISSTSLFSLEGFVEGSCLFSEIIQEISFAFSESYKEELLGEGIGLEEIEAEEEFNNQDLESFIGGWIQCGFEGGSLQGVLEDWMQGNLDSVANCYFDEQGIFVCDYSGAFAEANCRKGI